MPSIPRLIAEELTETEQAALRQFCLGRTPIEEDAAKLLIGLRLVSMEPLAQKLQITRLGKEVLAEVIRPQQ